jgi:hypothetical protein
MSILLLLNISNFLRSLGLVSRLILFVGCLAILAVSSYLAFRLMDYSSSNIHATCSSQLLTHPISRTLESVAIKPVNAAVKPDAAKP